ncbi:MAG: AraC family transcriptional regulator [Firmicutes bacterium]|nr:AraC family transcriptional regulator [Bacillota bacterium]
MESYEHTTAAAEKLYKEMSKPVIVYRNCGEYPYIPVPHLHSQYEIYYNIQGGRSFFVNKLFYRCEPHSLFVIPSTQIHKVSTEPNVIYDRCIINIDDTIISTLNGLSNMQSHPLAWMNEIGVNQPHKVILTEEEHERFVRMVDDYRSPKVEKDELSLMVRLLDILVFVRNRFRRHATENMPVVEPETWSDKAIQYIESEFNNDLSIREIANKLFINENHLCTIFKAETGLTINKYIILRKVAEAKRLLYYGYSVKEACARSGFNDYSNFIRTFKKTEGTSPSKLHKLTDPL